MRADELTTVAQDYLKVIWNAQEWSSEPVVAKLVAERIGVAASTVSEMIRRLAAQGLVEHAPYGAITLTDLGRSLAVAMVRRHRLLETFLVVELGYTWDEVHDEAEVLEHAVSERMLERMDAKLGHPERDPHGDPIPGPYGDMPQLTAVALTAMQVGESGRIARISDADSLVLRYLSELGLALDSHVTVRERRDYAGIITVQWDGVGSQRSVNLGMRAAGHVYVELGV
jgi:DtxR family Mn-dependent transcriptional regulator